MENCEELRERKLILDILIKKEKTNNIIFWFLFVLVIVAVGGVSFHIFLPTNFNMNKIGKELTFSKNMPDSTINDNGGGSSENENPHNGANETIVEEPIKIIYDTITLNSPYTRYSYNIKVNDTLITPFDSCTDWYKIRVPHSDTTRTIVLYKDNVKYSIERVLSNKQVIDSNVWRKN